MKVTLLWFRRDFRLHDNAALQAALGRADQVVPVYIHAPEEKSVNGSDWSPGAASCWWLHHSLHALEQSLRERGSALVIRRSASSLDALQRLLEETGATEVHWNRLYEPHAFERDRHIESMLADAGITTMSHAGCLLHEPRQVKTKQGNPYQVFTPFWKSLQTTLEEAFEPGVPLPVPDTLKPPESFPPGLQLRDLDLLPATGWTKGMASNWQPGEDGAHERLRQFLDETVGTYAEGRDFPARDEVSRLSPHLHFGELTPRQAWQAVKNEMRASPGIRRGAAAFLRELGWREFAHHVLFHFRNTPDEPLHEKYAVFPWRQDYAGLLRAWQRGETGYPIVDAGMRQLWQTGWMHNRVRMIAASMLVKNLRIPWQEGARWFWDTLVDADLANNTMGWQWAAGCGADAAPYFRIFNPMTQSEKFNCAEYIREFVPELATLPDRYVHQPWTLTEGMQEELDFIPGRNYPLPVVDYRESREQALAALRSIRDA